MYMEQRRQYDYQRPRANRHPRSVEPSRYHPCYNEASFRRFDRRPSPEWCHRPHSSGRHERSRSRYSDGQTSRPVKQHYTHYPRHIADERRSHCRHPSPRKSRSRLSRMVHGHAHRDVDAPARYHDNSRGGRSGRQAHHDKSSTVTPARQHSVKATVHHVPSPTPEPPVTFPELWGTVVTEEDERQMEQWRHETDQLLARAPGSARGQSVSDDRRAGRKRSHDDDQEPECVPAKVCHVGQGSRSRPPIMYINRDHCSVDGQRTQPATDLRYQPSAADDTLHHSNHFPASSSQPLLSLPSGLLTSATLPAACPSLERTAERGLKRRKLDLDVTDCEPPETQRAKHHRPDVTSADPGFDVDVEDDLFISDDEDEDGDDGFFSPRPRDGWTSVTENKKPRDGWTSVTENKKPRDGWTSVTQNKKPRDGWISVTENKKPRDGWTSVTENKKPRDGWTSVTENKKPRDDWTSVTESKKPRDGWTSVTESKKPRDDWTSVTENKKPRDSRTSVTEYTNPEPPQKKLRYSPTDDDDSLDLNEGLSVVASDLHLSDDDTLDLEEDLSVVDCSHGSTTDSGVGTYTESTDGDSSDGDTYSDSDTEFSSGSSADSDSESSDAYDSESEYSDSDDSDVEDECPDTCPCQGGLTRRLPSIDRKMGVSVPLYQKVLQCQLMRSSNRLQYVCCERYCSFRWPVRRQHTLPEEYAHSDLRVQHYSWGTWMEGEPGCPETCVCNAGQQPVALKKKERKMNVAAPLYKTLLAYRAMEASNREGHVCCGRFCCYSWRRIGVEELGGHVVKTREAEVEMEDDDDEEEDEEEAEWIERYLENKHRTEAEMAV